VRALIIGLTMLLILLQVKLWHGDGSFLQVRALRQDIVVQEKKVIYLAQRNQTLEAEVLDLKKHMDAIEERARTDLGMIRPGEHFYQYSSKIPKND